MAPNQCGIRENCWLMAIFRYLLSLFRSNIRANLFNF